MQPLSEIKIGDHVLAYNPDTGTTGSYTVTAVLVHLDPTLIDLTIDGERIETTPEHPFFTQERGWVNAGQLRRGEHVRKADGGYGTVQADVVVQRAQVMYNLTVAVAHTFFVGRGQWLVHNASLCDPTKGTAQYRRLMNKLKKAEYQPGDIKGNSGLGEGTRAESEWMGKKWVGENYRVNSDGSWTSADGLHQYRPPSAKSSPHATTGEQANFESRTVPEGPWERNAHLNITK